LRTEGTIAAMILALLIGTALPMTGAAFAADDTQTDEKITDVTVNLTFKDEAVTEDVEKEIKSAIERTLKLALLDQLEGSLSTVQSDLPKVTETIKAVLEIVLSRRGFGLEKLEIRPGKVTDVDVELALVSHAILEIKVEFSILQNAVVVKELVAPDEEAVSAALTKSLKGTPFDDPVWVTKLVSERFDAEMKKLAPYEDFDWIVSVVPAETTRVLVALTPKPPAPCLQRYFIKTRSDTLLNMALTTLRTNLAANIQPLMQLPISFWTARHQQIASALTDRLKQESTLAFYKATPLLELYIVRQDLSAVINVESERYRVNVSGRIDFNRDTLNPRIQGTFGLIAGKSLEGYVHLKFFPSDLDLEPEIGVGLHPTRSTYIGAGYDTFRHCTKLRARQWFLNDFTAEAEFFTRNELKTYNEFSLIYHFNDNYSIGAFTNFRREYWMAIVGNL
jgi:hypothetical protein